MSIEDAHKARQKAMDDCNIEIPKLRKQLIEVEQERDKLLSKVNILEGTIKYIRVELGETKLGTYIQDYILGKLK